MSAARRGAATALLLETCKRLGPANGTRDAREGAPRRQSGGLPDVAVRPQTARRPHRSGALGARTAGGLGPAVVPLEVTHRAGGQLDPGEAFDHGRADRVELRRRIDDGGECGRSAACDLPETCATSATWALQCSLPSGWLNWRGTRNVPRYLLLCRAPPLPRRGVAACRRTLETRPGTGWFPELQAGERRET
jgi:hypothetical protein